MKAFSLNIPISKVDKEQRIVYGYATKEEIDRQGDIVDYEASKKAFKAWAGNIREQHDAKRAVGKNVHLEFDDVEKRILIGAKISESADGENAWTKVQEGILTGFSIGGKIFKTVMDKIKTADGELSANRITDYELAEVSLVDVPACPSAMFVMVKSADGIVSEVEEMREMSQPNYPWFMKTYAFGLSQLNQNAITSHTTNMSKDSKEPSMSKDEISKATAVAGEEARDADAKVIVEDQKVEKGAVLGEVERDASAEPVVAEEVKAEKPKAAPKEVKKGLYTVAQLAECLENLTWIAESAEFEAQYEGDDSAVPAQLRAAIAGVGAVLNNMAAEEVAEAVGGEDVEVSVASDVDVELATKPADLVKTDTEIVATSNDALLKSLTAAVADKVAEVIAPLEDRIKAIEGQPVGNAPVRSYTVVDKVADNLPDASQTLMAKSDAMLANPENYSASDRAALMTEMLKATSRRTAN